ncbi:PPFIBP2 family protein [Megaselia abdita]
MDFANQDSEASSMLEEALKQMDGILISSSSPNLLSNNYTDISSSNVLCTAKTLSIALQQTGPLAPNPEIGSKIIFDWLEPFFQTNSSNDEVVLHYKSKLKLLSEKYRTLTDTATEQAAKIFELEKQITDKTLEINNYQDQLTKAEIATSSLENQRLAAFSKISEKDMRMSELRLRLAKLEQENLELKNNVNITKSEEQIYISGEELNGKLTAPKTPPASFRYQLNHKGQFHSLPRQSLCNSNQLSSFPPQPKIEKLNKNVAFAETTNVSFIRTNLFPEKVKGIKHIFGKLRRCNSGNFDDYLNDDEFRRGGIRSTANGRIECFSKFSGNNIKSYRLWNLEDICEWLMDLGLDIYIDNCKKWLGNGNHQDFFSVSPVDISKELNLKNHLHRKKIVLAINELTGKDSDVMSINAGKLNTLWVVRWLDDIGLPQYKDNFMRTNMDGRMLHKLTMEDLNQLQVFSCLHLASIKSAILVMRDKNWYADCLIRRSKPVLNKDEDKAVYLWTAHRVMEWLRAIDLAEYAPNLRGAGVHGGLMHYEPRFNADLLAELLSIPVSKTLLRRHLATHFKELLGRDKIQEKRDVESSQCNNQMLTLSSRIKFPKKTQFSLKRRKSSKSADNSDWSDYVCPMDGFSK